MNEFIIFSNSNSTYGPHEGQIHKPLPFTGAVDIRMPFDGTLILSPAASDPGTYVSIPPDRFMFYNYLFPQPFSEGTRKRIHALKNLKNRPFECENKLVLFFIANDDMIYRQVQQEYENASDPGVFAIELNGVDLAGAGIDAAARPYSLPQDTSLKEWLQTNYSIPFAPLLAALQNGISGSVHAFDRSGMRIGTKDAYRFRDLDLTKLDLSANEDFLIQLVDIHGAPVPGNEIDFIPPMTEAIEMAEALDLAGEPEGSEVAGLHFFTLPVNQIGAGRYVSFNPDNKYVRYALWPFGEFTAPRSYKEIVRGDTERTDITAEMRVYLPQQIDQETPRLIRICQFDPTREFQTIAGAGADPEFYNTQKEKFYPIFPQNGFKLFHENTHVKPINYGKEFFGRLAEDINDLKAGEQLFFANWKFDSDLHITGSMDLYDVPLYDVHNPETLHKKITGALDNGIAVRLVTHSFRPEDFTKIAQKYNNNRPGETTINANDLFNELITAEYLDNTGMRLKAFNTGDTANLPLFSSFTDDEKEEYQELLTPQGSEKNRISYGFRGGEYLYFSPTLSPLSGAVQAHGAGRVLVREGEPLVIRMKDFLLHRESPESHEARFYWKTRKGEAYSTTLVYDDIPLIEVRDAMTASDAATADSANYTTTRELGGFQRDWFRLGVQPDTDPPEALLNREVPAATILGMLQSGELLETDAQLLIFNIGSGRGMVQGLNETEISLPGVASKGGFALAVVSGHDPASLSIDYHTLTFHTVLQYISYSNEQEIAGEFPAHPKEMGGLLRMAIARDVDLKVLIWEQVLARLESGASASKQNLSIVGLLNREIGGKSGAAVLDRSGRWVGSFHQKTSILVRGATANERRYTAYLGGIDNANGRWDTRGHYSYDPERPRDTLWNDCQVRLEGSAAQDVLRNFVQRWHVLQVARSLDIDASLPRVGLDKLDRNIDPQLLTHTPVLSGTFDSLNIPEPNAMVQINRTIPPFTVHSQVEEPDLGHPYVLPEGELGSLESYKQALRQAKHFVYIEEQYFYSSEIGYEMRKALERADGPQFIVLVLPHKIDEKAVIDPILLKSRENAVNIIRYGLKNKNCSDPCRCFFARTKEEAIAAPLINGEIGDASSRVAVLYPVNNEGKSVYVHSKHWIVDDVWMSIGSANIGYRSLTYDFEVNAAIVGTRLFKGGSALVRRQRLSLWSRNLGLPESLESMLEDPYACFRLFKAIEKKAEIGLPAVKPFGPPLVHGLNLSDHSVTPDDMGIITQLDFKSPESTWIACNLLDADGRKPDPVFFRNLVNYPPEEFLSVRFNFENVVSDAVKSLLIDTLNDGTGKQVRVDLTLYITGNPDPVFTELEFIELVESIDANGNTIHTLQLGGDGRLFLPYQGAGNVIGTFTAVQTDNIEFLLPLTSEKPVPEITPDMWFNEPWPFFDFLMNITRSP